MAAPFSLRCQHAVVAPFCMTVDWVAAAVIAVEIVRGVTFQVGPPDVADEHGVAGEHAVGDVVVGMLVHQHADGLRGVPRGVHDLEGDLTQGDAFAVRE